jgi:hypothetical protein
LDLPQGTTGQLTLTVTFFPSSGDPVVVSTTTTLPDCGGSTTSSSTTTSSTTTTTLPPPPVCDCDGRQVTVQKVGQYQERIEKNRTGITCYNVRMVNGGFVISASGTEDALKRILR